MCLTIKNGCKIEKADKDILCYKIIALSSDNKTWFGICYNEPKEIFNKILHAKKQSKYGDYISIERLEMYNWGGFDQVLAGFHAYVKHAVAESSYLNFYHFPVHYAVIPKGAEYCFGNEDDIVASHMIVFRDRSDYDRYCENREANRERLWKELEK